MTCQHGILTACSQCSADAAAWAASQPKPKTLGDVVREHVKTAGTNHGTLDGVRLLELDGLNPDEARFGAANLYLAALSIIRRQDEELATLRHAIGKKS